MPDRDALVSAMAVLVAGAVDAAVGELPDRVHPVAGMGTLIKALETRRPVGDPHAELAWGAMMTALTVGLVGATGWVAERRARRLSPPARVAATALALKPAFALRGLVEAGRNVRTALETDSDRARDALKALVSRDRRLDPPHIVSAAVESLAENLTDSVLAPLLAYAVLGLPGAYAYRAVNTLDAMVGYRGDHEYVGKAAARLDDVANFVPARLAGLLLCTVAAARGRGRAAVAALAAARRAADSPNKMWTIAPMAGALDVQLEKPGHYRAGAGRRPLTPEVIDDAVRVTWETGAVCIALAAGLGSIMARRRSRRRRLRAFTGAGACASCSPGGCA